MYKFLHKINVYKKKTINVVVFFVFKFYQNVAYTTRGWFCWIVGRGSIQAEKQISTQLDKQ